ncbi:NAD(P)-binding protein [Agrocybe pediades]|nr:NAD(P)-binding protein [Agrocybe pediades]
MPQQPDDRFIKLSTADNPLTSALPQSSKPPRERAIERFSISGNAIVTGGAGDLGLEAARAMLEHGAQGLCLFDIATRFEASRSAIQGLRNEFPSSKITEEIVDVTKEDEVDRAVDRVAQQLGGVHVLLCFAGIARGGKAVEMSVDTWKNVQDTNTMGSWLCARSVARHMIGQKSGGSVVFAASIAAHKVLFPLPQTAYGVSKAGLISLTQSLAAEWAQHGIRVNSISPGFMDTVMTKGEGPMVGRKVWEERNPMGRMGSPTEVMGPVVMLCSPAGRYITGVDLLIDGLH